MARKFTWFPKFSDVLDKLPEGLRPYLILAIAEYGMNETEPCFDGIEDGWMLEAIFESVREDIDNSANNSTKNRGGRPRKTAKPVAETDRDPGSDGVKTALETYRETAEETFENPSENPGFNPGFEKTETLAETHTIPSQYKPYQSRAGEACAPDAPSEDEVVAYFDANCLNGDPHAFFDFYASQGWVKSNGMPIVDWHAQAKQWHRKQREIDAEARNRGKPTQSEVAASSFKLIKARSPEEEIAAAEEEAKRYGIAL